MPTQRLTRLARTILVVILVPSVLYGQVPPEAQETLDQLQDSPGLSINTAPECCPPPSIWDFLGYHDVENHIHTTLHQIAALPLFASLLNTINVGLQMVGLAPGGGGPPGAPGADGAAGAGGAPGADGAGGAGGALAQKIAADEQAADAKVEVLEFLGQQDCNTYPEIVPAILAELDDPIERVRYAALVALQRQCRELRCSTLPATRLAYRLHGQEFIPRCRQCASCACQDQVIKRLSDLLLDETALGYPKENSPRVRSLAAAIIEHCLQVHPPETSLETPTGEGVQPDPTPTPIPDPTPVSNSDSARPLFPNASFLQDGFQDTGSWFRRLLRLRGSDNGPTVYRGQEPDAAFDWDEAVTSHSSSQEWQVADRPTDDALNSRWTPESSPASSIASTTEVSGEPAPHHRTELDALHVTIAEAEETIRRTFAGRDDHFREEYENATTALFEARLALALSGDAEQLANLSVDAEALWEKTPNTFAAITALDVLTRYYQTASAQPHAKRAEALRNYALCLAYQIAVLEPCPEETPERLYAAARDLLELNMTAEAVSCLREITQQCAGTPIASEASQLLAETENAVQVAATVPEPTNDMATAPAPAQQMPETTSEITVDIEQLHAAVTEAEEAIRRTYSGRNDHFREEYENATDALFEARLALALSGDVEQLVKLTDDTKALWEKTPNTFAAITALDVLTRYYQTASAQPHAKRAEALRNYALCLAYQIAVLEPCPEETPERLYAAARDLLELNMTAEAVSCLREITQQCAGTPIASEASQLLAETENAVQVAATVPEPTNDMATAPAPAQQMPETTSEITVDIEQLHAAVTEAEEAIRRTYSGRDDHFREEYENATDALFEARLALALSGDAEQLAKLSVDTEALWEKTPNTFAAITALDVLTRYYQTASAQPHAKRAEALRNYALCLAYQIAVLEPCPEETPERLYAAARDLLELNMTAEAVSCLREITQQCAGTPIASEASQLLAETENAVQVAATVPEPTNDMATAPAPAQQTPEPPSPPALEVSEEVEQLYTTVAEAEETIRLTYAGRNGESQDRFESAMAALCESRLQLALHGDREQFERLHHTAATLYEKEPGSPSAAIAVDALTRYYKRHAEQDTPQQETALAQYAKCLRCQIEMFDPVPEELPEELLIVADALRQAGMREETVKCLNRILQSCPDSQVAPDATALLFEVDPTTRPGAPDAAMASHAILNVDENDEVASDVPLPPERVKPMPAVYPTPSQEVIGAHTDEPALNTNRAQAPAAENSALPRQVSPANAVAADSSRTTRIEFDWEQDETASLQETASAPSEQRFPEDTFEWVSDSSEQGETRTSTGDGQLTAGESANSLPHREVPQISFEWASEADSEQDEEPADIQAASIAAGAQNALMPPTSGVTEFQPEQNVAAVQTLDDTDVVNDPEHERHRLYDELAMAEVEIRDTFDDRTGASREQFENAAMVLCNTRLQLALLGDEEQFTGLYEDAETLCAEAPDSKAAVFAMDALARYYDAHVNESTSDGLNALRKYAGCLRYQIAKLKQHADETPFALYSAAQMLHRAGLEQDALSSLHTIVAHCAGDPVASDATALLAVWSPAAVAEVERPSPSESAADLAPPSEPATPVEYVVPQRTEPTEALAGEAAEHSSSSDEIPVTDLETDVSVTTADDTTPATQEVTNLETSLAADLPSVDISQIGFVQEPPPVPPAHGVLEPVPAEFAEPGSVFVEPFEDPFLPTPTEKSVYDRALEALEANEFAYGHLQEEDNIVERYNNSVGIEQAPYSPFLIFSAKPGNVFRMRFRTVSGYHRPDRSEYLWNRIKGAGPLRPETNLNYQQLYVYNETKAGEIASAFTEYPVWILDPDQNTNTAGPGDIIIGAKAVVIKDENWTVSSITRTFTPVGVPRRGLGRRHLSLESGVAIQLRAGRRTYLHSDLRFHYPLGAQDTAGEVLIGGIGFSRVLWSDPIAPPIGRSYALILTGETVITSFLDGNVTEIVPGMQMAAPHGGPPLNIGTLADAEMTSVMQNFGLRAIWTKRFSTGLSMGFPLAHSHTHDFDLILELQWLH